MNATMTPGDHVTVDWPERTIHGVVRHVYPELGQVEVWDGGSYVITDMADVRASLPPPERGSHQSHTPFTCPCPRTDDPAVTARHNIEATWAARWSAAQESPTSHPGGAT